MPSPSPHHTPSPTTRRRLRLRPPHAVAFAKTPRRRCSHPRPYRGLIRYVITIIYFLFTDSFRPCSSPSPSRSTPTPSHLHWVPTRIPTPFHARPCWRPTPTPSPSLDAHSHALALAGCPRPRPHPRRTLVLGDTRTGYPRTCACVPTCWVTTCTRTLETHCTPLTHAGPPRRHPTLARWRLMLTRWGPAHVGGTRTRWGARVRVGRHAYALGGACTCWGARVRVGARAYALGRARSCSGARACVGGRARALGDMRTRTYSLCRSY
jgi:hypothetical protein